MDNVTAIILGGGRGTRLYPLTKYRAKPAIPLAGKYRLVDITLSNCINSEINRIYVLTQFNSASLNQHISNTYRFSLFSLGFVEVLPAQQTTRNPDWFQGTADAVRKTIPVMDNLGTTDYLILSGDHLYRMDYRPFIEHHRKLKADITLSVIPVTESRAEGLGLMKTDAAGRIVDFKEKPKGSDLYSMRINPEFLESPPDRTAEPCYLASMGVYVFRKDILNRILQENPGLTDFGGDIIPSTIKDMNVQAYLFKGYWEDIGTVETFFHANLELVRYPNPLFSFYDTNFRTFSKPRFLPPTKIISCAIEQSMISDGCIIAGSTIRNSIIGIRTRIKEHSIVENSLLMGADYYQPDGGIASDRAQGAPPIGIGSNCVIRNAIIDKNARIGNNVKIVNRDGLGHADREDEGYAFRSGIVIVLKDAVITVITVI